MKSKIDRFAKSGFAKALILIIPIFCICVSCYGYSQPDVLAAMDCLWTDDVLTEGVFCLFLFVFSVYLFIDGLIAICFSKPKDPPASRQ